MTTQQQLSQKQLSVTISLRLATSKDFSKEISIEDQGRIVLKKLPKIGQPFWLKSEATGLFDPINYQISENTDWEEFKDYLRRDMVYVPVTFSDLHA
ncbi:MAG TPA: hypothetical protein VLY84_00085 [Dysgonamonadaceae bacterium]|nr:hypothetical protein [Dysgonamonadaceae bacterium]